VRDCKPYPRFRNLLKSARRRGVELNIDIDDWKELMDDYVCSYCGDDVSKETGGGLDRVDNNVGYEKDNLKVCCKICNSMKSTLSEEEFRNHIVKIYEKL